MTSGSFFTTISGGSDNLASGGTLADGGKAGGWVGGGHDNQATGTWSAVSGGRENTASSINASVSGGALRTAGGADDWAAGSLFEEN